MILLSPEKRIHHARKVQRSWADLSPKARASALAPLRRQIAATQDKVVAAIVEDTSKPPLDALSGDVLVTLEQMRYYERHA